MKNKLNFLIVIAIMVFVLGCSCGNFADFTGTKENPPPAAPRTNDSGTRPTDPASNKSLTDKATDVVTTGEKIGIQECDELMDSFRAMIENENTDFVTKAVLKTLEAKFREQLKQQIEQNQADPGATAAFCKEMKKNLDAQQANQPK
jgi:hypothetical protein